MSGIVVTVYDVVFTLSTKKTKAREWKITAIYKEDIPTIIREQLLTVRGGEDKIEEVGDTAKMRYSYNLGANLLEIRVGQRKLPATLTKRSFQKGVVRVDAALVEAIKDRGHTITGFINRAVAHRLGVYWTD